MRRKAALAAMCLVLAGCPDPVDDELLRVVEDGIPPDIALVSPQANGEIRSTVTLAGRITDSSFKAGDNGGVLDSIAIQVQAEPQLTRSIKLAGGSFTIAPADPTFTFDFSTGGFSIVLDTSSIDRSREFVVEATDRNGNKAEVRRLLFPSDGMLVALEEPGAEFTEFEVGGLFTIAGRVANSAADPAMGELARLRWEIVQNPEWSADLDTTPGATWDDGGTTTLYDQGDRYSAKINAPFPDVMPRFELLKADGSFTSSFTIPASGFTTLTARVTATDRNGMARVAERTVAKNLPYPSFILYLPENPPAYRVPGGASYYSSSAPSEIITVTGLAALDPVIDQLKVELSSPVGAKVTHTYVRGVDLSTVMNEVTGDLAFTVNTAGRQGDILLTVTARSVEDLEAPFPITIRDDRTAPSVTDVSVRSNNAQSAPSGDYARVGDTVTLDFTLSDAQTRLDPASVAVTIGGGAATLTSLGGGAFSATRVLAGGEPQALAYAISAQDMIGNSGVTSAASGVTFYEGPPAISGLAMTTGDSSPAWARAGEAATLSFAQSRDLAATPAVQIAGRSAAVSWIKPDCAATMTMLAGDAQGAIPFSIDLMDAAGNTATIARTTPATPSPDVTFDSVAPAAPSAPALAAASDSGSSNADRVTNADSWTLSGSGCEAGTVVRVRLDGGAPAATTPPNPIVAAGGTWTAALDVSAAAQGDRVVRVFVVDAAGNESPDSPPLTVTRDTLDPPVPTGVDLHQDDDSGTSQTDNLTNADSWRISGSHGAGTSTVSVRLGAGEIAGAAVDPGAAGGWSVTLDVSSWTDGAYDLRAVAVDLAGNESGSAALTVTRDTVAAAPTTPDLAPGSDTGRSNSDNITKPGSRTFTGTAESGAAVQVLVDGSPAGSGTADGGGGWSIAVTMAADGDYEVTARATDRAGNGPTASAGSLAVTIDSLAPPAPSTPDLASGSDTGAENDDNITNAVNLTFTGTAQAGATVEILVGGSPRTPSDVADAGGAYSITLNMSSSSGNQSISARATDAAGNGPTASGGSLSVRIDRAAPTVTAFVPSDSELLEGDSGPFSLAVTYSEAMDTAFDPSIDFSLDVSKRLSSVQGYSWAGNTVTASYTVTADGKDPPDDVVVTVQGARDVAGNDQAEYNSDPSAFAVSRSATAGARAAAVTGRPAAAVPARRRAVAAVPESSASGPPASPAAARPQATPPPAARRDASIPQAEAPRAARIREPEPRPAPPPPQRAAPAPTTAPVPVPVQEAAPAPPAPPVPAAAVAIAEPEPGPGAAVPAAPAALAALAALGAAGAALAGLRMLRPRRGRR